MVFWNKSCALAGAMLVALGAGAAFSQERGDPIGAIAPMGTFDRAQQVRVGKTTAGKIVCYFREQGDSHTLDIGMAADGAFIRLETGDQREATPQPPLRVFAGKQIAKGEYASDEFATLQEYKGAVAFFVPKPQRGDFVVVAKDDAKAFLDMVARARMEFVVVQSVDKPRELNVVAIYHFKAAAVPALIACAKARIQAAQAAAQPADIVKLFDNGNIYAVTNRPRRTTVFRLTDPARITRISTYHWNDGRGAPPGSVALRSSTGEMFGPWRAAGEPGQGGVANAYWVVEPDVALPAASYTIVDSNPSTWAQNTGSGGSGMATVEGYRE